VGATEVAVGDRPTPVVHFCGERRSLANGETLSIGRDADLVIDDNPFLHRRFLELAEHDGFWWLTNCGGQLSATVADSHGSVQAWLAPGAQLPILFAFTTVRFTAGSTSYEFEIELGAPPFSPKPVTERDDGTTTRGVAPLTPDQKLLIVALAEQILRGKTPSGSSAPTSAVAAARLGWSLTKFNRKLDNVCDKLTRSGVQGLHGSSGSLASSRRARLVEYAVAVRLVEPEDLKLLPLV
jgi:hypothetical protein